MRPRQPVVAQLRFQAGQPRETGPLLPALCAAFPGARLLFSARPTHQEAGEKPGGPEGPLENQGAVDGGIRPLFPLRQGHLVGQHRKGAVPGNRQGIDPQDLLPGIERIRHADVDLVLPEPGHLVEPRLGKAQPRHADLHLHGCPVVDRQPHPFGKAAELLAPDDIHPLDHRQGNGRGHGRPARRQLRFEQGELPVQHGDAAGQCGLQPVPRLDRDVEHRPVVEVAPAHQAEAVLLESVGMGGTDQLVADEGDVVVVEVQEPLQGRDVPGTRALVAGQTPRLDHLAQASLPVPVDLRGLLADQDDLLLVFQDPPGIRLGSVAGQSGPPLLLAADHLAHDRLGRVLRGHHHRLEAEGNRGQGEVDPPRGRGENAVPGGVADVAHLQSSRQPPHLEQVLPLVVGYGAAPGAGELHGSGGKGLAAGRVRNGAAHQPGLRVGARRRQQDGEEGRSESPHPGAPRGHPTGAGR